MPPLCGRRARETGIDPARLHPLVTLDRMFIPPSGFHVVPVLAYSPDPGPVAVVSDSETALVARVPLRAFVNPRNRLMVYRGTALRRYAGPAFLLNEMLVWGFTGHVISAMLDVAGWARPWDTENVRGIKTKQWRSSATTVRSRCDEFAMAGHRSDRHCVDRRDFRMAFRRVGLTDVLRGVILGAIAGVMLAPHVVSHIGSPRTKLFAALFLILALVVVGEVAGVVLGRAVRGSIRSGPVGSWTR